MEDIGSEPNITGGRPMVTKRKRAHSDVEETQPENTEQPQARTWREALGPPPSKENLNEWIVYQKKKWAWQAANRQRREHVQTAKRTKATGNTIGGFLKSAQRTLLNTSWQIIQVSVETLRVGRNFLQQQPRSNLVCISPLFFLKTILNSRPKCEDRDRFSILHKFWVF